MEVIAVANQKGGCGKTTSCVNLSAYLAVKGKKVLLIDLDPQGSSSAHLGIGVRETLENTMYEVMMKGLSITNLIRTTEIPGLDIAPTSNRLGRAELELASKPIARESVLKSKICQLSNYDFIVIDTPPTLGYLTLNALVACNTVLIPIQTEYFAIQGLSMILELVNMITDDLGHHMKIRYLLTMYDARTKLSKEVSRQVREQLGDSVFNTVIPQNIKLAEAPSYKKAIHLSAPDSPGAIAYDKLADEVIECQDQK